MPTTTVKYYLRSEVPGSRQDLVDDQGRALVLMYLAGYGWLPEGLYWDYQNEVFSWRGADRMNWYNQFRYQADVPQENIVGQAFADPGGGLYPLLPNYPRLDVAWRSFGYIYVPYGATNPLYEYQEVTAPSTQTQPGTAATTIAPPSFDDEEETEEFVEAPPEPTTGGKLLRAGLALLAGGLAGYATWRLLPGA